MAHHLAVSRQGQPQEGPRAAEPWRLSPMEAAALDRASAAALCAAAPEHPLGQEALALLVPGVDPVGLRRGLELGRQLNSPSWVAYLAYGVSGQTHLVWAFRAGARGSKACSANQDLTASPPDAGCHQRQPRPRRSQPAPSHLTSRSPQPAGGGRCSLCNLQSSAIPPTAEALAAPAPLPTHPLDACHAGGARGCRRPPVARPAAAAAAASVPQQPHHNRLHHNNMCKLWLCATGDESVLRLPQRQVSRGCLDAIDWCRHVGQQAHALNRVPASRLAGTLNADHLNTFPTPAAGTAAEPVRPHTGSNTKPRVQQHAAPATQQQQGTSGAARTLAPLPQALVMQCITRYGMSLFSDCYSFVLGILNPAHGREVVKHHIFWKCQHGRGGSRAPGENLPHAQLRLLRTHRTCCKYDQIGFCATAPQQINMMQKGGAGPSGNGAGRAAAQQLHYSADPCCPAVPVCLLVLPGGQDSFPSADRSPSRVSSPARSPP